MGGVIAARLYDKTRELAHSGKGWATELWRPAGWEPGQEVWRLEFELKRDYLKERSLEVTDHGGSVCQVFDGKPVVRSVSN